ncbi:MAG: hypothetical protein IIC74_09995 [Bacteroidetes bacterium]|nr:hypothetical protein [Bacteroidota bacterium]
MKQYLSIFYFFILLIGCKENQTNHLYGDVSINPELSHISANLTYSLDKSKIDSDTIKFLLHNGLDVKSLTGKNVKSYEVVKANNLFGMKNIPFTNFVKIVPMNKNRNLVFNISYEGIITNDKIIFGPGSLTNEWIELGVGSVWFPLKTDLQTKISHDIVVKAPVGFKLFGIENEFSNNVARLSSKNKNIDVIIIGAKDLKSINLKVFDVNTELIFTEERPIEEVNLILEQASKTLLFLNASFSRKINNQRIVYPPNRDRVREEGYSRNPFIMINHNSAKDSLLTYKFVAHEIAHFWWNKGNISNRNNFMNESLAEYSYLMALENIYGSELFNSAIQKKIDYIENNNLPSILESENYPYKNYALFYIKGPVALYKLELEIGRENLIQLLNSNLDSTTIDEFISSIKEFYGKDIANSFKSNLI